MTPPQANPPHPPPDDGPDRPGTICAPGVAPALLVDPTLCRAILSAMPDMMLRLSADAVALEYRPSPSCPSIWPPEQFLGRSAWQVLPPAQARRVAETVARVCRTGSAEQICYDLPGPDGPLNYDVRVVPWGGDQVVMLIRDVTDRRRAEQALRDSETRLRIQSRRMPISLFTWRAEGDDLVLVAYNPAAEEQSAGRVKRWLGARASELTGERADVAADLLTCLRERRTIHRQVEYAPGDGNAPRHLDVHYAFVPPDCVQVYAIDVTDRVRTNRELERERRFSEHILETAPYAIYVYDPHHGETIYANNQFEQVLGYSLAELRQTGTAEWVRRNVHMEDQSVFEDYFGRMLTQPDGKIVEREGRVRQPDGSIKWVRSREVVLGRNQDGQVTQVLGTAWDVTDAKNRERQIVAYQDRLRSLASELGFAEERERRRIAAGLHDRVSQNLVLSQIRLKMLHDACGDPDQRRTLEEVMDVLARTETDTRELTFEICPPVLYELGFGPALEWLAEQHERRYGLAIEVRADGDLGEIDPDLAGLLFQVARELLQNAADHARARRVSLAARRHAGKLELRVTDDGIGFDPERRPPAGHGGRGFGLFGVQERLRHEGGSLEIDSAPGRGTRVTAIVPIQ